MNTADVLDRAADLIWLRGRHRGSGVGPDGSLCVLGAINEAQGKDPYRVLVSSYNDPARVAFELWLGGGDARVCSFIWSDGLRPSPENDSLVVDTLRRCAKSLREAVA